MMIKSNGNIRYGIWDKGIYQKPMNVLEEKVQNGVDSEERPLFPVYDINETLLSGLADVQYSNGDSYSGILENGLRHGKVYL